MVRYTAWTVGRLTNQGPISWRILRLRSRFPAYVQATNFRPSLVSVECLVTCSTHAQKRKFDANPRNTLAVSTESPASISTNSVLTVSRAMKLGPAHKERDIDGEYDVYHFLLWLDSCHKVLKVIIWHTRWSNRILKNKNTFIIIKIRESMCGEEVFN